MASKNQAKNQAKKNQKNTRPLRGKPTLKNIDGQSAYDKDDRAFFRTLHGLIDLLFSEALTLHGLTWGQLAVKSDLAYQTVLNLGNRVTRWPQFKTIYKIARAVGYEIELSATGKQAKLRKAA